MNSLDRQAHWENVYTIKDAEEVSWFEQNPATSLDLIRSTGVDTGASIIDIGGGASRAVSEYVSTLRRTRRLPQSAGVSCPVRVGYFSCCVALLVDQAQGWPLLHQVLEEIGFAASCAADDIAVAEPVEHGNSRRLRVGGAFEIGAEVVRVHLRHFGRGLYLPQGKLVSRCEVPRLNARSRGVHLQLSRTVVIVPRVLLSLASNAGLHELRAIERARRKCDVIRH
jgi:hypothetical protein